MYDRKQVDFLEAYGEWSPGGRGMLEAEKAGYELKEVGMERNGVMDGG